MAEAGAVAGAIGAVLIVLAGSRTALLGGGALVLGGMAALAADGGQLDAVGRLFGSAVGVAALACGVLALAVAVALFVRWPVAAMPALLAVAPLRLPLASDPDSPVLLGLAGTGGQGRLYPLYAVLAAALAASAWRLVRDGAVRRVPRAVALPVAAFLGLVLVSFLWTRDRAAAVDDLLFFWLPFALLFAVAAQSPLERRGPRVLAVTLVAVAAGFAAFGLWQAATGELLFFNVALEQANALGPIFRVTSAFQDPNLLGRHLVLAIAVVLAAVWLTRLSLPKALAALALLAAGLWFTYSQSSLVALAVVALAIALAASRGRTRLAFAGLAGVLALSAAVALAVVLSTESTVDLTSDRSALVSDTAAVAASHPLVGVGVSAQPAVTRREQAPDESELQAVSHTEPLTVAAELGVLGALAFAALVAGTAWTLARLARSERPLAVGLGGVLLALLVHSLFYPGLFENPITWGTLGVLGAAAVTAAPGRPASAEVGPGRTPGALRSLPARR